MQPALPNSYYVTFVIRSQGESVTLLSSAKVALSPVDVRCGSLHPGHSLDHKGVLIVGVGPTLEQRLLSPFAR